MNLDNSFVLRELSPTQRSAMKYLLPEPENRDRRASYPTATYQSLRKLGLVTGPTWMLTAKGRQVATLAQTLDLSYGGAS